MELTARVATYVVILFALTEGVALPLVFYRGFVLERRYGLSQQTAADWAIGHAEIGAVVAHARGGGRVRR